jgi:hypothetical protein
MGQAYFILNLAECMSSIGNEFRRYHKDDGLVVFIFCPRNSRYYTQITESAEFWNRYSDRHITSDFVSRQGGRQKYCTCKSSAAVIAQGPVLHGPGIPSAI